MPIVLVPIAAVLVIALLLFVLYYAIRQFVQILANVFGDISIPGLGSIAAWIVRQAEGLGQLIYAYVDSQVHPFAVLIYAPVRFISYLGNVIQTTVNVIYNQLHVIIAVRIPFAINWADHLYNEARTFVVARVAAAVALVRTDIAAAFALSRNWADHLYNVAHAEIVAAEAFAISWADHIYNVAHAEISNVFNSAISWADHLYNAVRAELYSQIALVRAEATALFRAAENDTRIAIQGAETFAQAVAIKEADAAIAAVTGVLVTDIPGLWGATIGAIDDIEKVAAGGLTDAIDTLRGIDRSLPASIPAAITAVLGLALATAKLERDCVIPNCQNLSQVGRDIQALFGVVEDGALLAFLGAAIANPSGTARAAENELVPVLSGVSSAFKAMI